jgi:hypothetical protein
MTEYCHWQTEKDRIYLCSRPRPAQQEYGPDALPLWEDWLGFYVLHTQDVCIRHGQWPSHKIVANLGPTMTLNEALAAAKLILLSLKQTGSEERP